MVCLMRRRINRVVTEEDRRRQRINCWSWRGRRERREKERHVTDIVKGSVMALQIQGNIVVDLVIEII